MSLLAWRNNQRKQGLCINCMRKAAISSRGPTKGKPSLYCVRHRDRWVLLRRERRRRDALAISMNKKSFHEDIPTIHRGAHGKKRKFAILLESIRQESQQISFIY